MPDTVVWSIIGGIIVGLILAVTMLTIKLTDRQRLIKKLIKERDYYQTQAEALKSEIDKKKDIPAASISMAPEKRRSVWDPDWRPKFKR